LKIKSQGVVGRNPLNNRQNLRVDICRPPAYKSISGRVIEARAGANCYDHVGIFDKTPNRGWYTVDFPPAAYPAINGSGITQFRLSSAGVPNQDAARAYIKFYQGGTNNPNSPVLKVMYSLP
jgi:hypothetical protein